MKHSQKQYRKLEQLLGYINEGGMFQSIPERYKFHNVKSKSIVEIYEEMEPVSKREILANLPSYLNTDFHSNFRNQEAMIEELMDVSNLTVNHDKVLRSKLDKDEWFIETTSGTTGRPFPVVKNPKQRFIEGMYLMKCRRRNFEGATLQNGFLMIHSSDPYLKNIKLRGPGAEESIQIALMHMVSSKPVWVFSTAYLIKVFSEYIMKSNQTDLLGNLNLEFLETTSQALSLDDKDVTEKMYRARVVNNYGCREAWNIAYECKCNNLHVNDDYLMVDLINDEGKLVDEGDIGEVVITNLTNDSMPLIKYRLGDLASIYSFECECGLKSPVLKLEEGRKTDILLNTKYYGTTVFRKVLRAMYFWEGVHDIVDIRIVQDEGFHLSIYMNKGSGKDPAFEKKFFINARHLIEGFDKFRVDFFYHYPFESPSTTKDIIFYSQVALTDGTREMPNAF